uniref:DUF6985 domain-containing protein n=1 Tax=Thaumasiovibrio occultus TaxID=1891184 RepID=UPI000B35ACE0|nr:hypothetical protein [Thaumasiovibrio occultus]
MITNLVHGTQEVEGEFRFELFDTVAAVIIYDDTPLEYAERCVAYLNSLNTEVVAALDAACLRYCNDFLTMTGQSPRTLERPADIRHFMRPGGLIIEEPEDLNEPIIHLEMECDWDIEHGVEIIIRADKVLYVGGFNGLCPWSSFDQNLSYNFA